MSGRGHGHAGEHGRGHSGDHGGGHGFDNHSDGHAPREGYRSADRFVEPRAAQYDPARYDDDPEYPASDRRSDRMPYSERWDDPGYNRRATGGLRGPGVLLAMVAGLLVWSLIAWLGYVAVDPVMRWLAGSTGLLVDGGKAIAAVAGVGKEVSAVADGINTTGFIGQSLALVQAIVKPLIVVGWALGVVTLIAAPLVLRRIGGLRRLRGLMRH